MELTHEVKMALSPVTVLHVAGAVDGSNYVKLIDKVKELFAGGANCLLLDLEACSFLSSAGLFALHSIALIAHNIMPLNREQGWASLHSVAEEERSFKERFKIVHIQPNVARTLDIAGLLPMFDVYSDMQQALQAFKPLG